ncbi:hypothetical protein AcW1_007769 [Taiwanofungus camphoratus]|nr:hypothetical protein AcW2_007172 [Antrodia cinnamomea]KAI0923149.1 hypothetical protein AcV7_005738 [Antrodia cinnamomea]KAI0926824.1 hypothetical protein AcV5_007512 [Antrodia cinnamomea]KAI0953592.1 hypothetical protein AcW1_007769 [Antrodia cinnamomea]
MDHQEAEIPRLRQTIQALLEEGWSRNGSKLTTELVAFADKMEAKLAQKKAEAQTETAAKADKLVGFKIDTETDNATETLQNLKRTIAARPGAEPRHLVHLHDVHQSVQNSLNRFAKEPRTVDDKDEGLDNEVPEAEEIDKRGSAVFYWSHTSPGAFTDEPMILPRLGSSL